VTICKETKKQKHPSRGAAESHLRHLAEVKDYSGHVYPCTECQGWHVGRFKKNAHQNKFRKAG
jgi:hypothetical protein